MDFKIYRFVVFFFFILQHQTILSQNQNLSIALSEAINNIQREENISFSFDPDLIQGFILRNYDPSSSLALKLSFLTENSPFSYQKVNESYFLIKPRLINLTLSIKEKNSESGIPGVYIKKYDQYIQSVSNSEGKINFNIDWQKNDTLTFESLGYTTQKVSVLELLRNRIRFILMEEGSTLLNELVVTSYLNPGISADQQNHSVKIANGELGILPGDVDKDLLVSLKSIPGIHSVTGRAGELRIRGGLPDHNLILFNDIPIFHKGYYFGTVSPFSTDIVEKATIYRSGYTSALDGRVGGAIILESTDKVPDSLRIGLATNSYFGSAYVKAPIIKEKIGLTLSFRGAHPFELITPKESAFEDIAIAASILSVMDERRNVELKPVDFNFWDLNSSILIDGGKTGDFKLNLLTINNTIQTKLIDNNLSTEENRLFELDNNGISGRWKKKWTTRTLTAYVSSSTYKYRLLNNLSDIINGDTIINRITFNEVNHHRLGVDFSQTFKGIVSSLNLGYSLSNTSINFNLRDTDVIDQTPRSMQLANQSASTNGLYGNFLIPNIDNFMFDIGIRGNHYELTKSIRIEPRIFINYFLNKHFTFKTSFGLYSQDLTQNIFFDLSDIPNEKLIWFFSRGRNGQIITSWQGLFGGTYQTKNWLFDFDFYYKEVDDIATSGNFRDNRSMTLINRRLDGILTSKGFDFLFKYRFDHLDLWTSYTLSRTELTFLDIKTDPFPANYDQTHNFSIAASYQKYCLRASLGWFLNSGLPNYLENRFFPGTGGRGSGQIITEPTPTGNVSRFSSTHQLDASIAYQIMAKKKGYRLTLGLSVLNLYNRKNLLETAAIDLIRNGPMSNTQEADRFTIGFAPDFMIKLEW